MGDAARGETVALVESSSEGVERRGSKSRGWRVWIVLALVVMCALAVGYAIGAERAGGWGDGGRRRHRHRHRRRREDGRTADAGGDAATTSGRRASEGGWMKSRASSSRATGPGAF